MRALWVVLLLAACDGPATTDAGRIGTFCADFEARETCTESGCVREPCRGDEVCVDAACVPWTDAELSADFTLTYSTTLPQTIVVSVLPGGFPRSQVVGIRFQFGDDRAGWGESLAHTYASPGIYPVDLEVRLTGFRVLRASKLAVLDPASDHNPLFLTINEIPEYLNGQIPLPRNGGTPEDPSDDTREPFMLQAPRAGFELDVALFSNPEDPIDASTLSLTADVDLGAAAAGSELAARLTDLTSPTAVVPRWRWRLEAADAPPAGVVTFRLSARTTGGRAHERTLTFETVELTPDRDPFDRPMVWLFRNDSDFFTTTVDAPAGNRFSLASQQASNDRPDLIEELTLIGAQGPDADANARYLAWIYDEIKTETYRFYGMARDGTAHDDIAFTIYWQGEAGAPDPASFRTDGAFSMMRFGGTFDGFLGFSSFAPYNEERVDDSTAGLGVATATLLGTLVSTPVISEAFDPIKPGIGEPVGTNAADAMVLAPDFDRYATHDPAVDDRYEVLRSLAHYIALAIASVTAHEMGHAMGLMPDGVPPDGYFGNVLDVDFIDPAHTNPHHADFPGLNLMQAGGDVISVIGEALETLETPRGASLIELAEIISLENRLSPYERAYFQRRLTYASF